MEADLEIPHVQVFMCNLVYFLYWLKLLKVIKVYLSQPQRMLDYEV